LQATTTKGFVPVYEGITCCMYFSKTIG